MKLIEVALGGRSYDILIEDGLLHNAKNLRATMIDNSVPSRLHSRLAIDAMLGACLGGLR